MLTDTSERQRWDRFAAEAPAVIGEHISRLRSLERTNPGAAARTTFGLPGYTQANNGQMLQQGNRYLYGEDHAGRQVAPQRSATDVMGSREALQYFQRLGQRPPPRQPLPPTQQQLATARGWADKVKGYFK